MTAQILLNEEETQTVAEKPAAEVCANPLDVFDMDGDGRPDSIAFRELYYVVKSRPVTPPDGPFFKDVCLRLIALGCKLATGESIDSAPEAPKEASPNFQQFVGQGGSIVVPAGMSTHSRVEVVDPGPGHGGQPIGVMQPQLMPPAEKSDPEKVTTFLAGTVEEIGEAILKEEDPGFLQAIVSAEADGKERKGVKDAAAARLEVLAQV